MRLRSLLPTILIFCLAVFAVCFLWASLKEVTPLPNAVKIITGSAQHRILAPMGVAVNRQGNIYVPDLESSQIQIFNASGDFVSRFGQKGAFGLPWDVAIDSRDNVYVVDLALHRVKKFTANHDLVWDIGGEGRKEGQFNAPFALAVDKKDRLYVLDTGNSRVQVLDSDGKFINQFGAAGTAEGKFMKPADLDVSPDGRIFVVDSDNSRVQIFDATGKFLAKFGQAGSMLGDLAQPKGISIDGNGMAYVSDEATNFVNVFDGSGNFLFRFGGSGAEPGNFLHPHKSAVDQQGKLYVTDTQNNRIEVFIPVFHQGNYQSSECFSSTCHFKDPKKFAQKFSHTTVAPADECSSCHQLKNALGILSLKDKIERADICVRCHGKKLLARYLHGPIGTGKCADCHLSHGSPYPKLLFESNEELCYYCHSDHAFKKDFVHDPVNKGNCVRCHDPHSSEEKFLMKKPTFDICVECHGQFKFPKENYVHGPVAGGDCDICHDPHSGDNHLFLRKEGKALCFICHSESIIAKKNLHQPLNEEMMAKQKGCLVCHAPHQSNNKFQLREPAAKLCFSCHEEKGDFDRKYRHGPMKEYNCDICHDPHSSNYTLLLKFKFPTEKRNKFTDDLYELCFQCHLRSLVTEKTTTEKTNFRNGGTNLHYVHVFNKEWNCNICHDTHTSNNTLLIREFKTFGKDAAGEKMRNINKFVFKPTNNGGTCEQNNCHAANLSYDRLKNK